MTGSAPSCRSDDPSFPTSPHLLDAAGPDGKEAAPGAQTQSLDRVLRPAAAASAAAAATARQHSLGRSQTHHHHLPPPAGSAYQNGARSGAAQDAR